MTEVINHQQRALGRLREPFKNSPNIRAYLIALVAESDTLEQVLQRVIATRDIDEAGSEELDMIGELVGQPREILPPVDPLTPGFGKVSFLTTLTEGPVTDLSRWERPLINTGVEIDDRFGNPYDVLGNALRNRTNTAIAPSDQVSLAELFNDSNWCVDFWVYMDLSLDNTEDNILSVSSTSKDDAVSIGIENAGPATHFINIDLSGGDESTTIQSGTLARDRWVHVAVTCETIVRETILKVYLDGFLSNSSITSDLLFSGLDSVGFFGTTSDPGNVRFSHIRVTSGDIRFRDTFTLPTQASYLENSERFLNNTDYRRYIKFKIQKNHSSMSHEDILEFYKFIFDCEIAIIDYGQSKMRYDVSFGKKLTDFEKQLLFESNLFPKPLGVARVYASEYEDNNYFGTLNSPGAKGFGRLGNPSVGGKFARLIRKV